SRSRRKVRRGLVDLPPRNGGSPFPNDVVRFLLTGPRRHRDADNGERFVPKSAKLKMRARRNRQAHSRIDREDLFVFAELSPHLASAADEKPDLFDGSMRDRDRGLSRRQLEMRQAAAAQAEKDTDVRSVRRHRAALNGKTRPSDVAHDAA